MTAGALPSTDVQRRTSCASRGSVDMPSSVKLLRRTSSVSSKSKCLRGSGWSSEPDMDSLVQCLDQIDRIVYFRKEYHGNLTEKGTSLQNLNNILKL